MTKDVTVPYLESVDFTEQLCLQALTASTEGSSRVVCLHGAWKRFVHVFSSFLL